MKIWWQSSLDLGVNPVWDEYYGTMHDSLNKMARTENQVHVNGIEFSRSRIADKSAWGSLLHEAQVIKMALRAQEEGYDAFCLGCAQDIGYQAVREAVNIVVCNLTETSMHLAVMLGHRFAVLHYDNAGLKRMRALATRYCLDECLVPTRAFDMDNEYLQQAFHDPALLLDAVQGVVAEAARGGAELLVTGCGCINMILRAHGINEIGGVPILEGNGVLLKTAELMLDLKNLGIQRSPLAFPALTQEETEELRRGFLSTRLA